MCDAWNNASSRQPAGAAYARETDRRVAGGPNMDLRTEVGRVSRVDLPRPRRNPHSKPRCEVAESILSRVARTDRRAVARAMRPRRRNRRRKERGPLLRGIAASDSSRSLAGETAFAAESGVDRLFRPAL